MVATEQLFCGPPVTPFVNSLSLRNKTPHNLQSCLDQWDNEKFFALNNWKAWDVFLKAD
ncbi:hypothetical protein F2Q68_00031676 [Brassica cretica]|uniref:Uncharacterized protein n=1 Tax=Brassica cretica TaxID=69181 RepID=A0A8S9GCW1_BRACR|nr:hypothetical protein F2Q68_00031676 [Brassica cretica]KAF3602945.1 hypothetical protein F2Q69_00036972 [Brassica cretica]